MKVKIGADFEGLVTFRLIPLYSKYRLAKKVIFPLGGTCLT